MTPPRFPLLVLCAVASSFGLLLSTVVFAAPLITEFQASNSSTISDEDGDNSDWIEIFNPDGTAVDLGGYYLTDDATMLTKWQIPATTSLSPSSFLVVFASSKDRAVAGAELHTNFKLSSAGEYLALVAADGTTIVDEYALTYPQQFEDSSYGLEQLGNTSTETVIDTAASCKVHVPDNGVLGTTWTAENFNDTSWQSGTTSVGYERSSGYSIQTDIESDMYNQRTSAYVRVPFTISNVGEISGLELQLQYDDGFVAYLNGTVVASDRAPGSLAWNSAATSDHPDASALQFNPFNLSSFTNQLLEGSNVLAIHALNRNTTSSDMLLQPRLIADRLSNPSLGNPGYFLVPTPGSVNGTDQGLPASSVIISQPSQTFTSSFQVTLSGAQAGQTIRYTTDESAPNASSTAYSGPITISSSTQLRARIFGANNASGPIAMATYIFLSGDVATFSSNLPIVILENWSGGKPSADRDGFWAIIEPDAAGDNRAHIGADLDIATRCNMKVRGSSSAGFAKYSLSLEAQDEDKEDQAIEPLGMPSESDWVLSGRYTFDRALMRNPLIYQLSNESGEYAVRTRFVEVFLNTGGGNLSYAGDYFGVYTLMEKIKRDKDRVGVAKISTGDTAEPEVSGGYMWKKDRLDPGDGGFSVNTMGTFGWVEPKEEEVVSAQETWLRNHLNELDTALYHSSWTNPTTGKHFTEYLDTFSWLRHHWMNTLAKNVDGFRLSGYYYKHRDPTNGGKVGAGPIWDFDRTMESTDGRDNNPQGWDGTGDSSQMYGDSRFPWWGQALTNPDFRQAHTDLWHELRQTTFSTANIHGVIDSYVAQLDFQDPAGTNPGKASSPQARNFSKWTAVPPRGGYSGEITILKNWYASRLLWIDGEYTDPPQFTVAPGQVASGTNVSFSGAGGTVYYTTDGSDPRLPGGNVSASASTSAPVNVSSTTIITARARSGTGLTSWSGPIKGTYLVGPIANASNLVISELHYAPAQPSLAEQATSLDAADFEWIELTNIGAQTIDLTDVHFENGVDFTFTGSSITTLAPGERVLVVSNQAAFEARYGSGLNSRIAGEFSPSRLDNAGERIHLVDALGATIQDFTYNDKFPWPSEAGFPGYSLVLIDDDATPPDHTVATNWRSSTLLGGNPNSDDSTPLVGDPMGDDDGDGMKKILEYALGTSDADPNEGVGAYSASVETISIDGIVNDYMVVTFQRDLAADDVDVRVEISNDVSSWSAGAGLVEFVSETNQGDGTAIVKYRSGLPLAPEAIFRSFARLTAELR